MKVPFLIIKGTSTEVMKQLKSMTEEEFEALKQKALKSKGA